MSTKQWRQEHREQRNIIKLKSYHKLKVLKPKKTEEEKKAIINKRCVEKSAQRKELLNKHKVLNGCADCGQKHEAILTYHHKDPENKRFGISDAAPKKGFNHIVNEIAKCEILCFNCHAIRHWQERKNSTKISEISIAHNFH